MTRPQPDEKDRRFATTLARGLSVLRAFRSSDNGLGNADIAQRTALPKSTVSRMTFTLQALGYLTQAGERERYRPGPALLALGNMASASMSFVDLSEPVMQRLADRTRTLCVLAARDENKVLLVKTWRPVGVPSLWLEVGHRLPFNGSSSGHALLAAISQEQFEKVVLAVDGDGGLDARRAEAIRKEASNQLLTRGYVVAPPSSYFTPNIHAVSVPFHARDLRESFVFTCGAVPEELSQARIKKEVGPELKDAVGELDRLMGQSSDLLQVRP